MTHQPRGQFTRMPADAGRQIAQLRDVLALVEELADRSPRSRSVDLGLTEAANISGVYGNALPIVQRRFDALAAETARWSAAALEALLGAGGAASPAAAATLADELDRAITEMIKLLRH